VPELRSVLTLHQQPAQMEHEYTLGLSRVTTFNEAANGAGYAGSPSPWPTV